MAEVQVLPSLSVWCHFLWWKDGIAVHPCVNRLDVKMGWCASDIIGDFEIITKMWRRNEYAENM